MRALRRHYEQKYKQRCRKIMRNRQFDAEETANDARQIGRFAQTRKPCSCFMCGNPRRHFGEKTIRERRLAQSG